VSVAKIIIIIIIIIIIGETALSQPQPSLEHSVEFVSKQTIRFLLI
jgi:hypothetical protein